VKLLKLLHVLIKKIGLSVISFLLLLPIIAGIIAPMLWIIGGFLYLSWILIGANKSYWTWGYILIPPERLPILITIEVLLFITGLIFLSTGLYEIISTRFKHENITQKGLYKIIRHPQHLGIILLSLPFALYVPCFADIGIRVGELFSWGFFASLLWLYSHVEEWRLMKNNKETFTEYYRTTGFFFPYLSKSKNKKFILKRYRLKFLMSLGSIIITFLVAFLIIQYNLENLAFFK
jgi:protein-S-isoprenylcysteine O-methyltransferase Ste14